MPKKPGPPPPVAVDRPVRVDARRNIDAILEAALAVFSTTGVDAPVREIAERAGVGLGTIYRHFPERPALVVAVFRQQIGACAEAAPTLAAAHRPGKAVAMWLQRYARFIATKRGLAKTLHSGNAEFKALPAYFDERLRPALQGLLDAAAAAGELRTEVAAGDLLKAVGSLCMAAHDAEKDYVERMVALLVEGLLRSPKGPRKVA